MKLFEDNTDITDGIDSIVWRAIDRAIDMNSVESFRVLKTFVRQILQLSIINNSNKHFQKYILFPAYYYSSSYEKSRRKETLLELHKYCSAVASRHLKEIIWFDIGFVAKGKKSLEEKRSINQLYYWAFQGFSRLLYFIIKNGDINQFRIAMEEYEQISDEDYNQNFNLKWEIEELERDNSNGNHDEIIKQKKEEYKIIKEYDNYKRHILTGIKYWIFFLYDVNKIKEETAMQFLENLNIPYADSNDLVKDILFFRTNQMHYYMGWRDWDYIERPLLKAYSPPDPYHWLTSGFFADQIREKKFYININELNPDEISKARFLYDELKSNVEYYKKDFDKWAKILKVNTLDEFQSKSNEILKDFALVKRKSITESDRAIALAQLYQPSKDNFKKIIGDAWKSQARIHRMFKLFGNSINMNDQDIKLKLVGRRTFFEKAKKMFTEKDNETIYGVDRMGGEIGRLEDNYFFSTIHQSEFNKVSGTNVLQTLEEAFIELKKKDITPTLILLAPKSGRDNNFLESKKFASKLLNPQPDKELAQFYIGSFDGIPVYTTLSNLLNNSILICNFSEAFQMQFKTNSNWYDEELTVDIFEVTEEEAQRKLEENPTKWTSIEDGGTLTKEEAILMIKTSVIIDIWTTIDFKILNKDAFVIGFIKSESDKI